MNVPKWFKVVAYPSWFGLVFFISLYMTFPMSTVRSKVVSGLEKAMGKGAQGRHGSDPSVQIGSMTLANGLGVKMTNVNLQFGSRTPDPGMLLMLDELVLSTSVFSIFGSPSADLEAKLYGGTVDGHVELGNEKFAEEFLGELKGLASGRMKPGDSLKSVKLDVDNLRLDMLPPMDTLQKMPLSGALTLNVDLDLGKDPSKEADGNINLAIEGGGLGPGEHPLAGSIPLIRLGKVSGVIDVKEGKGTSEVFKVDGQDLKADASVDLTLSKKVGNSRLKGTGWFQFDQAFLQGDGSKIKMAYDLVPQLKRAKDDEEKVHFKLRGTLKKPGGSFDSSKGRSKAKTSSKRRKRNK